MSDCLKCIHFLSCEPHKTYFHKISGEPCKEFEKAGDDNE